MQFTHCRFLQMQHSLAQSRQRQNALPKVTTSAMQNLGVNGSFLVPGSGALLTPGVKVEPTTGGQRVTSNGGGVSEDQEQNKELENIHKLVSAIQRYWYLIMFTCKRFSFSIRLTYFGSPALLITKSRVIFSLWAGFTWNVAGQYSISCVL